jgi:HEAT repeat protein
MEPISDPSPTDYQKEREQEIEHNSSLVQAKDPLVREQAVKRLGQLRGPVAILLKASEDPNDRVRSAATAALGEIPPEELTEQISGRLMEALDDLSEWVCSAAIRALGRHKVQAAREALLSFLNDPNPYIIREAILALARLHAEEALPRVVEYLDSDNRNIRAAAIRAVGYFQDVSAGPGLVASFRKEHAGNHCADPVLCDAYIESIINLNLHEAVPLLVEIARQDVGARGKALRALSALNANEVVPLLVPLLADPSERLREAVIAMIISSNYQAALPLLRTLLKDENAHSRYSALAAVNAMKDMASVNQIRWMCHHESAHYIRTSAIQALSRLLGMGAMDTLVELAVDLNTRVRSTVLDQFCLFSQAGSLPEAAYLAIQHLAQDPIPEIQAKASALLSELGPPAGQETIIPNHAGKKAVFPAEMGSDLPFLLVSLENWRNYLLQENMPDEEEISRVDQALSLLISLLQGRS